ncbi:MAG: PAS domain S-box protein [Elusimicrobia bacterium]|nr:PAS domain S-box protein [Elusimicrobiota bacterium]
MRWTKNLSLRWNVLLGFIPVLFGFVLLLGLSSYFLVRRQILLNVENQLQTLLRQASSSLGAFFQRRSAEVEAVGESPLFEDYAKNVSYGLLEEARMVRKGIDEYLWRFSQRAQVYREIIYLDFEGRIVSQVQGHRILRKPSSQGMPIPKGVLEGQLFVSPIEQGENGWILRYASPRRGSSGKMQGTLLFVCDLRFVQGLLEGFQVGARGKTYLTNREGHRVMGSAPSFAHFLMGERAIPKTPWNVVTVADLEEFLVPVRLIAAWIVLFSIAIGLCLSGFIVWRVQRSLRPVQDLVRGTEHLASGNLDYQFPSPEVRELKALADSFNAMTLRLRARTEELRSRVRFLEALREMERAVMKGLDEEAILRTALRSVARGLSLDRTALYWVDKAQQKIVGRYVYETEAMGLSEQTFRKRQIPLGAREILNEVVSTRQNLWVRDPLKDLRVNPDYVRESKTREFLLAPICGKNQVFGVFAADNYYSYRALQESDQEGLGLFANAAGLAIENLGLFRHLAQSEARYRAVLDNSPVAILGLSSQHRIATWSRGAEEIFGYAPEQVFGKPVSFLFSGGSGQDWQRLLAEVMTRGSVREFVLTGLSREGKRLELSLSWGGAYPDFWMNREWTVVIRDVTDAKKLQQQIIRSEKLSAVGQLISSVAHELNNPLQAVVGYAEFLSSGQEDAASMREDLRLIRESALRCTKIVQNLLFFVRRREGEKIPVELPKVVQAALELLEYKLKKEASVSVTVRLDSRLPRVLGDFQQLEQVVINLVNNACDAVSPGAGAQEIRISGQIQKGKVRVEVSDSGPGIPESARGRLFDPFFTTKPAGRGTGLGLTVCRQILEEHGGRIGLQETAEGSGATFWFELPVAHRRVSEQKQGVRLSREVRGKRVLVVDDEPAVLALLRKSLEAEGEKVEEAQSFRQAAQKVSEKSFDLVVTDVRLGDGTGIELYEGWESFSHAPRPTFLFVTGDILNEALERDFRERHLPLLEKPVSLQVLRKAVRLALAGKSVSV